MDGAYRSGELAGGLAGYTPSVEGFGLKVRVKMKSEPLPFNLQPVIYYLR
jgi:hypothetical protein